MSEKSSKFDWSSDVFFQSRSCATDVELMNDAPLFTCVLNACSIHARFMLDTCL